MGRLLRVIKSYDATLLKEVELDTDLRCEEVVKTDIEIAFC